MTVLMLQMEKLRHHCRWRWDVSKSEGCLGSNSDSVPASFVVLTKWRSRYLSEFLSSSVNKDDDDDDGLQMPLLGSFKGREAEGEMSFQGEFTYGWSMCLRVCTRVCTRGQWQLLLRKE